ncbi:ImmA/IrrE family metallo-endopeptidase [Terrisporobacter muris]|uniref:ImmA/IrrE family metallo-endopeptidase n=1 Tax=Terrisporobacter muris TaxID=2963284 RepID=A0A9X2S434_9FIRM|nr:ImmA/IrrE family metallo-endopeptidase [Terrisporobacter muris]MCR1823787.1 ImmA/IrrE family metallo-endopeptidase [Terrisporobacter muris]
MTSNIPKLVSSLIKKYNTRDPYVLAECLDIEIIEYNLSTAYGMYKLVNRNKFIFLNSKLDEITKRFVLSHELGHAILHRTSPGFYFKNHTLMKTSIYEIEANTFAAELIISDNEFKEFLNYGYTISQMASYFNVTEDLIKLKLDNL